MSELDLLWHKFLDPRMVMLGISHSSGDILRGCKQHIIAKKSLHCERF